MSLDGKVAIVTGAASGIGCVTALALAQHGAAVACCDINGKGGREVAEEIISSGGKALGVKVDISKKDEVDASIRKIVAELGRIDILVNCAAYLAKAAGGPFRDEDVAEWDRHIDTTLKGTLYVCKAVVPLMMEQASGRIINITSAAAKGVQPGGPYLYPACKAAIAAVSKGLAAELARYGILVNCIAPGPIKTSILLGQPPEYLDKLARPIPLKHIGEPEDVAGMVVFLASEESKFITGQHIAVDGGLTMTW